MLTGRRSQPGLGSGCVALAGGKAVATETTALRTQDDDIDGVSLMSSDSEEERGITLGNAPDAQGAHSY